MAVSTRRVVIGVMGSADPNTPKDVLEQAETTGRLIAEADAVLLCGGRTGIMEAAARGAQAAPGGETLAILPGSDPGAANPFVDLAVATGMGNGRNVINVLSSDAIIAFPGGAGTLSEMALALKCGIHVVGCSTWDLEAARSALCDEGLMNYLHKESSPSAAVSLALDYARVAPPKTDQVKEEILSFLEERARSLEPKDPEAFIRYYFPCSTLTLVIKGKILQGMEPIRTYLSQEFQTQGQDWARLSLDRKSLVLIPLSGRTTFAAYRYGMDDNPGWCCSSIVVRRQGNYGIVADHFTKI